MADAAETEAQKRERLIAQAEARRRRVLERKAAQEAKKAAAREPDAEPEAQATPISESSDTRSRQMSELLVLFLRTGFVTIVAVLAGLCRNGIFTFALTASLDVSPSQTNQTLSQEAFRTPKPSPWELFLALEGAVFLYGAMHLLNNPAGNALGTLGIVMAAMPVLSGLIRDMLMFFVIAFATRWAAIPFGLHQKLPLARIPLQL